MLILAEERKDAVHMCNKDILQNFRGKQLTEKLVRAMRGLYLEFAQRIGNTPSDTLPQVLEHAIERENVDDWPAADSDAYERMRELRRDWVDALLHYNGTTRVGTMMTRLEKLAEKNKDITPVLWWLSGKYGVEVKQKFDVEIWPGYTEDALGDIVTWVFHQWPSELFNALHDIAALNEVAPNTYAYLAGDRKVVIKLVKRG